MITKPTREFFNEGKRTEEYSFFDFLHGYLYGRWPYLYIGVAVGEHRLSKVLQPLFLFLSSIFEPGSREHDVDSGLKWANGYHGKVVPVEEARRLVSVSEDLDLRNLEQVIPFSRAKDIILKNPEKIAVLECPCRAARPDPCLPLDVCVIVGDPFVSFILEHQPDKSRLISSDEAMQILDAEHARGHVQHAFFKDAMLNRFYAICNCCSCCCGAFQAHQGGSPMLMPSGYRAQSVPELCSVCGTCLELCQFDALEAGGDAIQVLENCFGCGVCVDSCPEGALLLVRDHSQAEPLEITRLANLSVSSPEL